ncbi:MAG: hypothetical protein MEP57_06305 [Microvirga sp.]|nr:hypothetical protein [Microvirga sp.]
MLRIATTTVTLALALFAAIGGASAAVLGYDDLPHRVREQLREIEASCAIIGGRPGDPMEAIAFHDFDADGMPDIVFDQNRFRCGGFREGEFCPEIGCYTYVTLSRNGRWTPAFEVVGSYCVEVDAQPPRFVTIQRNFTADGATSFIRVRYRFQNGLAIQDGRGSC